MNICIIYFINFLIMPTEYNLSYHFQIETHKLEFKEKAVARTDHGGQ